MYKILKIKIIFLLCLTLSAFTLGDKEGVNSNTNASNDNNKSLKLDYKNPIDAAFIKVIIFATNYRCDEAAASFESQLNDFETKNGMVSIAYRFLSGCYETIGKYSLTAQYYKKFLLHDGLVEDINYKYYSDLAKLPEMEIKKNGFNALKLNKNNTGHYEVKIKINNKDSFASLDTGANGNFISRSKAKELDLDFYGIGSNAYSASRDQIPNEYAIAKKLEIGGSIFNNVLFIVIDDEKLTFSHKDYNNGKATKLDLVVGFPIFFQLGAIEFSNSTFKRLEDDKLPNDNWTKFAIKGFNILIPVTINGTQVEMQLDTGSLGSNLGQRFIDQNPAFTKSLSKSKYRAWSIGGVIENEAFLIENPKINIGNNQSSMDKLFIVPSNLKYDKESDGLLGLDIIKKYENFTIDFKSLKIRFGKALENAKEK